MMENRLTRNNGKNQIHSDKAADNCSAISIDTLTSEDTRVFDDELKMALIAKNFREIMQVLGLDLTDDSLKETPNRVAKMFVKEIFSGLNQKNKTEITLFRNEYDYNEMLVETNISLYSICEHHFLPIIGRAHVAYIPNGHIIGLSKINRIVQHFAKRPQVQERLTVQIANELKEILKTEDVTVMIEANHLCVSMRGIEDSNSHTVTTSFSGKFEDVQTRDQFLKRISRYHVSGN